MYKYPVFGNKMICERSYYMGEEIGDEKLYLRILSRMAKLWLE